LRSRLCIPTKWYCLCRNSESTLLRIYIKPSSDGSWCLFDLHLVNWHSKKFIMKRKLIAFILPIIVSTTTTAQNYSGLQFKKLTPLDDISAFIETQLGSLFNKKISGKIDSVVVTWDSEKTLKARIYYKDFVEGYFTVSTLNNTKQKQN